MKTFINPGKGETALSENQHESGDYLRDLLKPPTWEYTIEIKIRFKDGAVIAESDRRINTLVAAIELLTHGFIDNVSGGRNMGEYQDWEAELKRHAALQSAEIEIIPHWRGSPYKVKKTVAKKRINPDK